MTGRPYVLSEIGWPAVRKAGFEVAVLPWGATEAHNLHLPYGTDTLQVVAVAEEAARLGWAAGARIIVLPAIPFGVQTGQLDIPLCINLNPSTQAALLRDVALSLQSAGVRKLVILNGHGGNDFRAMVRELQPALELFLCTVDWWRVVDAEAIFEEPGDHAGELETSVMLHLAPHLLRPLGEAGEGRERRFRIAGLREGWAWAPRSWSSISDDTGVGNPRAATRQKGEELLGTVSGKLADFLTELAATSPDDLYDS
jgi:creatinine amidohydrolase